MSSATDTQWPRLESELVDVGCQNFLDAQILSEVDETWGQGTCKRATKTRMKKGFMYLVGGTLSSPLCVFSKN